jgi:DnaJ-domain-containing protein 1
VLARCALLAGQAPAGPSAIEHALAEFACRRTAVLGTDQYQGCYRTQIAVLRADFGPDLNRLTPRDRLAMDSACSPLRDAPGRDVYLSCLNSQLDPIRARLTKDRKGLVAEAPLTAPLDVLPFEPAPSLSPQSSSSTLLWIGVTFVTTAVAAGGAYAALRLRRPAPPARTCHVCGAELPGSGDLCADCRHAAAETRRSERAAHEQAVRDAQQARADEEERQRLQQLRHEEDARARAQEEAQEREERQRQIQSEAEIGPPSGNGAGAAPVEEVFNPHAILEVAEDAGPDAIHAAYEQARSKYDPALFSHLGVELQEHFKAKAQAVEKAYQMLGDRPNDP